MSIPKYNKLMLPLLEFASDKEEHSIRSAINYLADLYELTEEEKRELLPSGSQPIFDNRAHWAKTYLKKAGLIEYTKRGHFKITERGLKVLEEKPEKIDNDFLEQFNEFVKFKEKSNGPTKKDKPKIEVYDDKTPKEVLEEAHQTITEDIIRELLDKIKEATPDFFEKLVVDLLINMGYGGSRKDAGKAIGKVNDGGIDGIINEDRLGLDIIYIQAKKWGSTVGRPEIQKFAGALEGKRAKKGIFITTSQYSREALNYVSNITSKIILIDGELLAKYMVDFNVGVSQEEIFEIKSVDSDYFIDE